MQIKNLIDKLDSRLDRTEEGITQKTDLRKSLPIQGKKKKINGQKMSQLYLENRMRRSNKYVIVAQYPKQKIKNGRELKFKETMAENFQN